jgi:hypothetical protein
MGVTFSNVIDLREDLKEISCLKLREIFLLVLRVNAQSQFSYRHTTFLKLNHKTEALEYTKSFYFFKQCLLNLTLFLQNKRIQTFCCGNYYVYNVFA